MPSYGAPLRSRERHVLRAPDAVHLAAALDLRHAAVTSSSSPSTLFPRGPA
jgi:hypothetical protein